MIPATGIRIRIRKKYKMDATWPVIVKGGSMGCPPIQVRVSRSAARIQNRHWLMGRNIMLHCFDVCKNGMSARTRIESTKARTPPSLLGIDCRMVYANKYHSGLIWGGVLRGLAGV